MLTDHYGLALSTTSQSARDAYVEGCDLLIRLYPGAAAAFDAAIAADPGFALAHAGRARAFHLAGDMPAARAAIATAQTAPQSQREAAHIAVVAKLIAGQPGAALEAVRTHLATWPTDAMVLATSANETGLIALSGRAGRKQELVDFLDALAPAYPNDPWFNAHHAMALSEAGQIATAMPMIETAMARDPRNAYGAHAMAHLLYETAQADATIAFMRAWLPNYPREGLLHGHLTWHLALVELGLGHYAEAMHLFDTEFAADPYTGPNFIKLLDGPSFLWRAELAGHAPDPARWAALRAFARATAPQPGMPFADWHVALADAAAGPAAETDSRLAALEALVNEGRYSAGATVLHLARAFAAYKHKDYAAAIEGIEAMLPELVRIGGSRAQLDLVEATLLKACLAAGRADEASHVLERRRTAAMQLAVA